MTPAQHFYAGDCTSLTCLPAAIASSTFPGKEEKRGSAGSTAPLRLTGMQTGAPQGRSAQGDDAPPASQNIEVMQ